ncbi:apelin [Pezoporus flaviventris]|uniref:apelin n=1 Tax=Pezoporus flaviventris TaxID=889875 RepID=UPI002AB1311A|nr:apelin [Pezoporus flaviventris]
MTGRATGPGRALTAYKCGSAVAGPQPPLAAPGMAAPRWFLALLLLFWLALAAAGPLGAVPDGQNVNDGLIRTLVRPRGVRLRAGHRPGSWRRYRRPRPRLSHKGPMPF